MSVNHSTNISYWRWIEPLGSETTASPPQPSLPGDESLPKPQELSRTELLQKDVSQREKNKCIMVTC